MRTAPESSAPRESRDETLADDHADPTMENDCETNTRDLIGSDRPAHQRRDRRMHGFRRSFSRNEYGKRRGRSAGRSSALHQRAHCSGRRRIGPAIAGRPFAAPVVVANVRPDPFDHVRLRGHRIDDGPGAPALSPADAAFLGHGFATVVVLASDAFVQGDLLDESS